MLKKFGIEMTETITEVLFGAKCGFFPLMVIQQ